MRRDIAFQSHGLTCRGWFYPRPGAGKAPAIVMSHGFSAVKEMRLDAYAERFQAAGFGVVVFDYRFLGASDGTPRGHIVPQLQHDDIRAALGFAETLPEVDADRLGLWGSSYSGGHALFVGALDPRVKAIVVQAPATDVPRSLLAVFGAEAVKSLLAGLAADHGARNVSGSVNTMPVVAADGNAFLPTPDSHAWFIRHAAAAPSWVNHVTMETVARAVEYIPASLIDLIAPRPLLVQAAAADALIPLAHVREAFARAGDPKTLEILDCGHFDIYEGTVFEKAVASQIRFLRGAL